MRGVYEASVPIAAITAAKTLLYITAPANKVVDILHLSFTNRTNETNEQCECTFHKVSALGTPTAATITPTKTEQGDGAAASTVKGEVTASEPTYTSAPNIEVGRKGFPSLVGYEYGSPDNLEPLVTIAGGDSWGFRLLNNPASFDGVAFVRFRERG